jgi:hypothetical protein
MSKYYAYCGKVVWPNGEPEDWEVTWEPTPWVVADDFRIIGLDAGPYIVEC